jgi:hypothetical protein
MAFQNMQLSAVFQRFKDEEGELVDVAGNKNQQSGITSLQQIHFQPRHHAKWTISSMQV